MEYKAEVRYSVDTKLPVPVEPDEPEELPVPAEPEPEVPESAPVPAVIWAIVSKS